MDADDEAMCQSLSAEWAQPGMVSTVAGITQCASLLSVSFHANLWG